MCSHVRSTSAIIARSAITRTNLCLSVCPSTFFARTCHILVQDVLEKFGERGRVAAAVALMVLILLVLLR